jgi:hypothetical protein
MSSSEISNDSAGTSLFPQFEDLRDLVESEVHGLTDAQLDWTSDRWEWSRWSIRRQVSHIANVVPSWLLGRWRDVLFPDGVSGLGSLAEYVPSAAGSWLDEASYPGIEDILQAVTQASDLASHVLAGETAGSLRNKEVPRPDTPPHWRQFILAHPTGVRYHETQADFTYLSLEATFRHLYYEVVTHLYNVQRLKRAQGLTAVVELPNEGYWTLPDWDRSEP